MKIKANDWVRLKPYDEVDEHWEIPIGDWEPLVGKKLRVSQVGYRDPSGRIHIYLYRSLYIWPGDAFEPWEEQHTIVVFSKGTDTVAIEKVDNKEVKRTVAKLSPKDEYKWETGRDLALNRLLYGVDYHPSDVAIHAKVEPYEGRVVCVDAEEYRDCYTKGKIYEVKYGRIETDDGIKVPGLDVPPYTSFDEFNRCCGAKWVEIVE